MATRPDILIDEWLSKSRQVTFAIPEARDGEFAICSVATANVLVRNVQD
jgi:hypothetical protein